MLMLKTTTTTTLAPANPPPSSESLQKTCVFPPPLPPPSTHHALAEEADPLAPHLPRCTRASPRRPRWPSPPRPDPESTREGTGNSRMRIPPPRSGPRRSEREKKIATISQNCPSPYLSLPLIKAAAAAAECLAGRFKK